MATLVLQRRDRLPGPVVRIAVASLSVAAGLFAAAMLLAAGGHDPLHAYGSMWDASFGSEYGLESIVIRATPLIFTGLAVAVALQAGLWNIGGEGQLLIGAVAGTGVGLFVHAPGPLLLVLILLAAAAGGAAWAMISAVPRAMFGLNEIITSLFLNYIAALLMKSLIFGPWGDPTALGFAYSRPLPRSVALPLIGTTGIHVGIFIALAAVTALWWAIRRTPWGFGVRITGGNTGAARYLRLPVKRQMIEVMALSGALAGLAGGIELTGVTQRLQEGISANYGYTGVLIAFLAGRRVVGVVVAAFLFATLVISTFGLQVTGVADAVATVTEALIIVFLLAGEAAVRYRVRVVTRPPGSRPWFRRTAARHAPS